MAVQERKDLLLINFDNKNFFLGSKKKMYGDKLQVKLFCFSEKVGKVVTRQTADIYVKM